MTRRGGAARREISSVAHRGLDLPALFDATERALRRALAFDGCCWLTLDPATYLPTSHVAHNSIRAEDVPLLARNEILEDDVNKLADLARSGRFAGILHEATGGEPERSRRFRELLRPNGFEGELRAALVDGVAAWGGMALYRRQGSVGFAPADRLLLTSVSRILAEAIRRAVLLATVRADERSDEIGLVLLEPGGTVETMTAAARRWLDQLIAPAPPDGHPPNAVSSVAYRALLAARSGTEDVARSRVRTGSGHWLILHGSVIGDPDIGRTAVIVEPAKAAEIAPLIVEAYGFTPREREIVAAVLRGGSTDEIAHELHVSSYTVQDHLKSVFDKVGVRSRRELVAHVFFQHYAPRMGERAALGPSGWFATPR